jgi:hypothetical protein
VCGRYDNCDDRSIVNALYVIQPYWHAGTWVFDDEAVGLVREPFVSGVPQMIDWLVRDLPEARNGFRLIFSADPFPGFQAKFERQRAEMGGTWYRTSPPAPPMEGWLCPALFKYFAEAPPSLYARAEALAR